MDVTFDAKRQRLTLNSESYVGTLAQRFNMVGTNGRDTPCEDKLMSLQNALAMRAELKAKGKGGERRSHKGMCEPMPPNTPYRAAVGSLMFLSITTRPDIAFAVNQAARFVNAPTVAHWRAVKRILMYVVGTKHLGLVYQGGKQRTIKLTTFSDSDWGGEVAEG